MWISSLLLLCLFFGLISVVIPEDRGGRWVSGLLIVILFLFVCNKVSGIDWAFPEWIPDEQETLSVFPEREALHQAIRFTVFDRTGTFPSSVETDLSRQEDQYSLRRISVVIPKGDPKEVQNELEKSFAGATVVVCKETGPG